MYESFFSSVSIKRSGRSYQYYRLIIMETMWPHPEQPGHELGEEFFSKT
jgi:hypothetical protein